MACRHVPLVVVQMLVVALFGQDLALSDFPTSYEARDTLQILTRGLKNLSDQQSESQAFEGQVGHGFALLCFSSTSPPKWDSTAERTQKWLQNMEQSQEHISIGPCDESLPEYKFCTELYVDNPNHLNTGRYSCENDKETAFSAHRDVYNGTKEVYIYVQDYSNAHALRAKSDYFIVKTVHEHQTLVLPCLPSHPNVNVTFLKLSSAVDTNVLQEQDSRYTFNPQIGFEIQEVNALDQGQYLCNYFFGNLSDSAYVSVQVIPALKELTKPNVPSLELVQDEVLIKLHSERTIRAGSNFQLFCNVTKDLGPINLSWKHNGEKLFPKESAKNGKGSKGEQYTYSIIDVWNATELDQGNYSCNATNNVGQTTAASVWLHILNDIECQIGHVTTPVHHTSNDKCVPIDIRAGDVASLVVKVDYISGKPHEIKWKTQQETHSSEEFLKPSGGRTKYSFHHPTPGSHSALLKIYNVSISDHGLYSFFCPNDVEDQIQFCLNVKDVPRATLKANDHSTFQATPTLYSMGRTYEFHCSMTGNPRVEQVRWRMCWGHQSDCEETIFNSGFNDSKFRNVSNGREFDVESFRSYLVNASSAKIECQGCSKDLCGNTSELLIQPIDYYPPKTGIFGVCVSSSEKGHCEVIEELADNAKIERYKTQSLHIVYGLWIENRVKEFNLIMDVFPDVDTYETNTKFSQQSHVIFGALDFEHSGKVSCQGKNLVVHVKNISIPTPINGSFNMDDEDVVATLNKNQPASLQCATTGIPEPKTTWFKDEKPLNVTKMAESGKIALTHKGAVLNFHELQPVDAGVYICQVENLAGTLRFGRSIRIGLWHESAMVQTLLSIILLFLSVVIILVMLTAFLYQRNKLKEECLTEAEVAQFRFGDPKSFDPELPIEEQTDLLPYDDDIEFPKDRLKLGQQIGSGAFGRVVQAVAFGIDDLEAVSTVAVKMVKPPVTKPHLVALMSEIKIMLHIGKHLNVVNILGAVTKDLMKRELLVIVEYCCHGSLQQFLQKHRKTFVNQVNPLTGTFDPNKVHRIPRFRKRTLDSKRSSDVNYATLEIHNKSKALDDEDDTISPLPNRQKKVSNVSRHSFDDTSFMSDSPNIKDRRPKVSIISTDSEFDTIGNTTDMTCISGVSPRNRIHKVSVQSTDSEFEHIENATDMTYLVDMSNRQQNPMGDDLRQTNETRETIATKDLLSWAYQVAKGMEYLANKRVIHGDLAARNILLAENNVVKIGDFGLARNVYSNPNYKKTSSGPLPIKWMAVESLMSQIFSTKSDVWSYGIVLWELFSLAKMPYPGIEPDESFPKLLEGGYRMEKPSFAPDDMYKVMRDCWSLEPSVRPDFATLADKIGTTLHEGEREHYLILNKSFEEENELRQTKYVYLQHIPTKTDSKSDEAPSEISPMLPNQDQPASNQSQSSTQIDQGFAFFNPSYSQIRRPHPSNRPIMGQKRQASSRSLLACKHVSEADTIQPFLSQNQLDLSKHVKTDLAPTAEVELQIVQHHSSSSLSSGFHSNSSDVLKSSLHKRHLEKPFPEERTENIRIMDRENTPPPSYDSVTNVDV